MEFLLQYLDDLDDLYGALGLIGERLRRILLATLSLLSMGLIVLSGVWLAQVHLPMALATVLLLFVALMYRAVTAPRQVLQTTT